jgi:hypothetical protein
MNVTEESDRGVLPMNHSNKVEQSMAESEEGRPLIKENIHQSSTPYRESNCGGFQRGERGFPNLQRTIALLAHLVLPQDSGALRNAPS